MHRESTMNTNQLDSFDDTETITNAVTNRDIGIRFVRVVILAACYFLLEVVAKTVTVAQFLFVVWKKRPHQGMARFGNMISEYMHALWRYCTFASDDPPWPFRPWPRGNGVLRS